MTEFRARVVCEPHEILCEREPAGPLVGLFRLHSHDETGRVEAAIFIAMHFIVSNMPSPREITCNLRARNYAMALI